MESDDRVQTNGASAASRKMPGAAADAAVWLAIALAFFTLLGSWALFDPDEGRNALISLEMARSGDWLLPTIAGLPFLDKPFLYFATVATAIRWLGPQELAARLPSAIFGLGIVAMTFGWARRELGAAPARIAALACASIPLLLVFSRLAILDACLSFFVVAAILAFERSVETCDGAARALSRGWSVAAWAAMSAGVLVKGPVALLVPLLVAAPYAAWRGRSRAVWWPGGPALLLLIVVPWLVALERRSPGFLRYALVTETLERVATDKRHRSEPFWYFAPFVLGAAFPWSWIAFAGVRNALARARECSVDRRRLVFLALWFVLPLLAFSSFRAKRPQYIVPLLPALALWAGWLTGGRSGALGGVRAAAAGWLGLATASALFFASSGAFAARFGVDRFPAAVAFAGWFAAVAALCGAAAWMLRREPVRAAWALAAPVLLLPWLARDVFAEVAETRSARALVRAIEPRLDAGAAVVAISAYPPSAAFYLDRPLVLSSADAEELTSTSIPHDYEALVGRGNLRREDYWKRLLAAGTSRPLFVTGSGRDDLATVLVENGYRETDHGKYSAWLPGSGSAAPNENVTASERR